MVLETLLNSHDRIHGLTRLNRARLMSKSVSVVSWFHFCKSIQGHCDHMGEKTLKCRYYVLSNAFLLSDYAVFMSKFNSKCVSIVLF